jgi:hypothetical protein
MDQEREYLVVNSNKHTILIKKLTKETAEKIASAMNKEEFCYSKNMPFYVIKKEPYDFVREHKSLLKDLELLSDMYPRDEFLLGTKNMLENTLKTLEDYNLKIVDN